MSTPHDPSTRKAAHLEICTAPEFYQVESGTTGFQELSFIHNPLPQTSFDDVSLTTKFLGKSVSFPFFISSMTGGSEGGYALNKDLARAAEKIGIPVGMGSIRILFRKPEVFNHFRFRKFAPSVPFFANIGSVQIRDMEHREIFEVLNRLEADGIAVHLNPAQELFQPEGDRDFRSIKEALYRFFDKCPIPVIVKETGCGIPRGLAVDLVSHGASYIDVAGSGGTNWMRVEDFRETVVSSKEVEEFDSWGIPTALNLSSYFGLESPRLDPVLSGKVLSSGGLRSGMDGLKSLALGASLFGMALPVALAHKSGGYDGLVQFLNSLKRTLHRGMLLLGVRDVISLPNTLLVATQEFLYKTEQLKRG